MEHLFNLAGTPAQEAIEGDGKALLVVRSARLALGLTQQALGEKIGYTGRTAELVIQSIESGRRKVPRAKVKALADLLRLDPMRLL